MGKSIILMLTYINLTLLLSFPATSVIAQTEFWEPINTGLTSTDVRALAINSSDDIFAATNGGVFRSSDNGDTWTQINTGLTRTSINALAINSNHDIFAGSFGGHVFRSSDNGDNWSEISLGVATTIVVSLAINGGGDIFAGTLGFAGDEGGVFRSTDNGANWSRINAGLTSTDVRALAINNSGDIFAGTNSGVFRSSDNGDNWRQTALMNISVLAFAINSSGDIFAGTNGGVFRSSNNGDNWSQINTGLTNGLVRALASNRSDIFAGTEGGGVFRSSDNGNNWSQINTGLTNTIVQALDINSNSDIFAGTEDGMFRNAEAILPALFGNQIIITSTAFLPAAAHYEAVYAADLDGDGDIDVLSASSFDDKIAWYENTDGLGAFGPQRVITTNADGARSVFAADLDGDGDIDVLSASSIKIAWYQNTDGQGSFGAQRVITTAVVGARSVFAADLDGDGDIDVLSASTADNKIAAYQNTDGLGAFGPQQVITTRSANGAEDVHAADLDGDGDIDVLSASRRDDKIVMYGNNSPGHVITTRAYGAMSVFAADLDGDGDMDVLSASWKLFNIFPIFGGEGDKIAWYRNLSSPPTSVADAIQTLSEFRLLPNYPNPFNPETTINYELPEATAVKLEIYNILGQRVATLVDSKHPAGAYSARWDGKDISGGRVSSGVYIYRLQTDRFVESKKMLLLR